jgi:hypothetical protein
MIGSLGEKYGFHVIVLALIAQRQPIGRAWFDTICKWMPFLLENLDRFATALPELFTEIACQRLREALWAIDEIHGPLHQRSCRKKFLGDVNCGLVGAGKCMHQCVRAPVGLGQQIHSRCNA